MKNFQLRSILKQLSTSHQSTVLRRLKSFAQKMGPGLVTGASDDDPSGIATYSQAGAAFGLGTLWTALITFPLMAAVQEMCARIGIITTQGLTGTIKTHYPKWVLYSMLLFSFPAIVLNIGADLAGMGTVTNLLVPDISASAFTIGFTFLLMGLIIWFPYRKIASILKYLCVVLLVYFVVPFMYHQDLLAVLKATFIPQIQFTKVYVSILVAILGTTISPYLFYWQATMEAEELKQKKRMIVVNKSLLATMKKDVDFGMLFSNFVMYFIILTTGTVLFQQGIHQIDTVEQAAQALQPLLGQSAYILFATGVIGTGLIGIPVLSGSLSYIISETFGWKIGLDKPFQEAIPFYLVIIISLLVGLGLNYAGITPLKALIYSAILYGITAPVIIAVVLHISNNQKIMGTHVNGRYANTMGMITLLLMSAAVIVLAWLQFS